MQKVVKMERPELAGRYTMLLRWWRCWVLVLGLAGAWLTMAGGQRVYAQESVDRRSGHLKLAVTDLVVPAGPVHLEVRRWLEDREGAKGLLGAHWHLNWERRLIKRGDAILIQEEGGEVALAPASARGEYRGPGGERLVYAADGRAVRSKGDGSQEIFDADGRLVQRDERNGNKILVRYGASGQLSAIEGPYRSFLRFSVDGNGQVSRVESSSGETLHYAYAQGKLIEVETADGRRTRYAYDHAGLLVRVEDVQSGATEVAYDEQRRVVKRRWADGSQEVFAYEDTANRVRYIDLDGGTTTWRWSPDRRREEITDALGSTGVLEYDTNGRLLQVTGPTGQTARFTYDTQGRLVHVQDPAGGTTRIEYLGEGALVKSISPPLERVRFLTMTANGISQG